MASTGGLESSTGASYLEVAQVWMQYFDAGAEKSDLIIARMAKAVTSILLHSSKTHREEVKNFT
jgi:hypothetical protein